jgi:nucleoside-diphosphate-sugar epimerase
MGDVDLLVLGGTRHVGRAVVEEALRDRHTVTTVNRGLTGRPTAGAETLHADRTEPGALEAALGSRSWDAVIDTWSGAPRVVAASAGLLADRVGHYGYVSSRSVYRWPIPPGADESAPVVDGDPESDGAEGYAAAKRGSEVAVTDALKGRALVARAGLILGPYEQVGRLPWWLRRLQRGGLVLAPGPYDRPLQYIDARDLARWMISCAEQGVPGTFNTVSRPGHTTFGELLAIAARTTGADAELVWASPEQIAAAGVQEWTELPIWVPPTGEAAALHDGNVDAAVSTGLHCRPVHETVEDTWEWLDREGDPPSLSDGSVGLDPGKEEGVVLAVLAGRMPG